MSVTIPDDPGRRLQLAATSVTGGVGLLVTAVPFVASMAPSERAKVIGAPVEVDLQGRGPRRTQDGRMAGPAHVHLQALGCDARVTERARRPAGRSAVQTIQSAGLLARNADRSAKPEFGVLLGICTHLGCIPTFRPTPGAADIDPAWPGGFFCPCHGSKFDLVGRVFKNVPAPTNLSVPPYHFTSASKLLIGSESKA